METTLLSDYYLIPGAEWSLLKANETVNVTGLLPNGWYRCVAMRDGTLVPTTAHIGHERGDSISTAHIGHERGDSISTAHIGHERGDSISTAHIGHERGDSMGDASCKRSPLYILTCPPPHQLRGLPLPAQAPLPLYPSLPFCTHLIGAPPPPSPFTLHVLVSFSLLVSHSFCHSAFLEPSATAANEGSEEPVEVMTEQGEQGVGDLPGTGDEDTGERGQEEQGNSDGNTTPTVRRSLECMR